MTKPTITKQLQTWLFVTNTAQEHNMYMCGNDRHCRVVYAENHCLLNHDMHYALSSLS